MITAKVVADSITPSFARITTLVLTYPRFAHAEFMTHRMFSRNASSSRAIPVKKQIEMVMDNPAIPIAFTKNQKGMQGGEALSGEAHELAVKAWLHARDNAASWANELTKLEVHKQYANRLIEPFAHISVVVTATEWDNFMALRYHPDALPEMQELAKQIHEAMVESKPHFKMIGEWHTPFYDPATEKWRADDAFGIRRSAARCARVSYLNHEGKKPAIEEDFALYDRLANHKPMHASPLEHQAMSAVDPNLVSGNFKGWIQFRKLLKYENVTSWEGPNAK